MVASGSAYFSAGRIANDALLRAIAGICGSLYFLSIAFGTFYVFPAAHLRGASLGERVLASALVPFLWMTKEVLRLTHAHPLVEALYWYVNPLSFWLVSFMVFEMGVGTLIARALLRRRGHALRVITPAPVVTIVLSLGVVIGAYAWGRGENLYVIFLAGYRALFGAGV